MHNYPREDKCRYCGQHLGYVMNPVGDAFALGLCDKPNCQAKDKRDRKMMRDMKKAGKNGESNKGK